MEKKKKKQVSNFKAVSMDEKTAAAYCAEKSFHSVRNPLAADFSVHLHRLRLRTELDNGRQSLCWVNMESPNRHTVSFS